MGQNENIFIALIHQSISKDPISLMALNYRYMMGINTVKSKAISAHGFNSIYKKSFYKCIFINLQWKII